MLNDYTVVYEESSQPGGHCRSIIRDGWTFDLGPHIMFSRNRDVLDFMIQSLRENVHQSRRHNRVFVAGSMVKYPFENDLAALDIEQRARCLLEYLFNSDRKLATSPQNLDEWFIGNFGSGMTDLYFRPYNEKIWKIALRDLSMSWSERIPSPPAVDVVKGALGVPTEGYVHQLNYSYPLEGGYQAITDAWAERIPPDQLRLGHKVIKIEKVGDVTEVTTSQGSEAYDRVISTVPMPVLVELAPNVPDRVREAVNTLRINPINVVTLGYRGTDNNKFTAVYLPDSKFLPNRISSPSVFSPRNAPEGCYSLQAEITFPPGNDYFAHSDDFLVEHVHNCVLELGLVERGNEPIFHDVQRIAHAYVVYAVGYEDAVRVVREWATSQGIEIHGRFGSFDYLNVDGCISRSQELASRLTGRPVELPRVNPVP